ncbi:hypothetical protein ACRS8P_27900 [Burkholderia cenocepacia]
MTTIHAFQHDITLDEIALAPALQRDITPDEISFALAEIKPDSIDAAWDEAIKEDGLRTVADETMAAAPQSAQPRARARLRWGPP